MLNEIIVINLWTSEQSCRSFRIAQNIDCTFGLIAYFLPFKSDSEFCLIVSERHFSRLHRLFFLILLLLLVRPNVSIWFSLFNRSYGWCGMSENGYSWSPIGTNNQFQPIAYSVSTRVVHLDFFVTCITATERIINDKSKRFNELMNKINRNQFNSIRFDEATYQP